MTDDFIGMSFILFALCNLLKKDARVDTEHPLLQILLRRTHLRHIRLFRDTHLVGRANQVCSGT